MIEPGSSFMATTDESRLLLPGVTASRSTGTAYRLYFSTVLIVALTALAAFGAHEIVHNSELTRREGQNAIRLLAAAMSVARVTEDNAEIGRLVETVMQNGSFGGIRYRSGRATPFDIIRPPATHGNASAPGWLTGLTNRQLPPLHQVVLANDGTEAGMLRLEFDPTSIAMELWERLQVALLIAAWVLITGLFVLRAALKRLLVPLERVSAYADNLARGPADASILLRGKVPEELKLTFELLAATANRLQKDLSDRNDTVESLRKVLWKLAPGDPDALKLTNESISSMSQRIDSLLSSRDGVQILTRLQALLSHNIRSPISVIIGDAETLATCGLSMPDEERSRTIHRIQRAGTRVLSIIDDATVLAHLSGQQVTLNIQRLALRDIVDAALADIAEPLRTTRTLEISLQPRHTEILSDPVLLTHIVKQLLANAYQFNRDGGSIRISSEDDKDGWILSFTDNGPGIDALDMEHLCTPFYRGANSDVVNGTGLGLSIARAAAGQLGGKLSVAAAPVTGTTAALYLPGGTLILEKQLD